MPSTEFYLLTIWPCPAHVCVWMSWAFEEACNKPLYSLKGIKIAIVKILKTTISNFNFVLFDVKKEGKKILAVLSSHFIFSHNFMVCQLIFIMFLLSSSMCHARRYVLIVYVEIRFWTLIDRQIALFLPLTRYRTICRLRICFRRWHIKQTNLRRCTLYIFVGQETNSPFDVKMISMPFQILMHFFSFEAQTEQYGDGETQLWFCHRNCIEPNNRGKRKDEENGKTVCDRKDFCKILKPKMSFKENEIIKKYIKKWYENRKKIAFASCFTFLLCIHSFAFYATRQTEKMIAERRWRRQRDREKWCDMHRWREANAMQY